MNNPTGKLATERFTKDFQTLADSAQKSRVSPFFLRYTLPLYSFQI